MPGYRQRAGFIIRKIEVRFVDLRTVLPKFILPEAVVKKSISGVFSGDFETKLSFQA